jgi:hypothetical protein
LNLRPTAILLVVSFFYRRTFWVLDSLVRVKYVHLSQSNYYLNLITKKAFNRKRKRQEGLDHISRFNDHEVKQQTSLSRSIFNFVLKLIEPKLRLSPVQERMARVSSGEDDIRRLLVGLDTVDITADVIAGNICSNGATSIDDESEQLA